MIHTLVKTLLSFGWNARLLRCAALSLLLYRAVAAAAQDYDANPTLEPIYTYPFNGWEYYQRDYQWLTNNTLVIEDITRDPNTGEQSPLSVLYDPYAPREISPSTRVLPPAMAMRQPSHVHQLPFTFGPIFATSPDGRFDLHTVGHYVYNEQAQRSYHLDVLGVVDRVTGQYTILPDVTFSASFHDLQWSSGSGAFVLSFLTLYGVTPFYIYVTGFGEDVTKAHSVRISTWDPISDLLSWDVYQIYDLDSTGKYLLADGYLYNASSDQRLMRLILLNMEDLSYEIVSKNSYFTAAQFVKPDDQHVVYVSDHGVFAYDRLAKTRDVLTRGINAHDTLDGIYREFYPTFSPDGRYLVTELNSKTDGFHFPHPMSLYIYPIPPIPEDE